ncbi:MAG: SLBB domain-containing protein, partial [Longimicrobiales bacterium]
RSARRLLIACTLLLAASATDAAAQRRDTIRSGLIQPQDPAGLRSRIRQQLGPEITNDELLERLRESGVTRAELRTRLQQLGYDPGLADRYFDMIETGGSMEGEAPQNFLDALTRVGLTTPGFPDLVSDSLMVDSLRVDSISLDAAALREIEVFGLEVFREAGREFEPVPFGPVDPGYRLGPGDEITLVLTGDVEAAYPLNVSREGLIFIPDVGQISVNGITLGQLEDVLYSRLGEVYSGISRSVEATTHFSVSIGRLRMNQVFLTGDVRRPGSYQVSAAATVFNALYRAGGPTEEGSFRNVTVSRGGDEPVVVDLYDYLLYGDGRSDVRIEQGDRIFVPPAGRQVRMEGQVQRPAIYEMRSGEGLRAAIAFAGGLEPDAVVSRVQIDRILPPGQREPGLVRVLRDVNLDTLLQGEAEVPLQDGDIVTVSAVSTEVRNRVWLTGEVRQPGTYEWSAGTTLEQILARAEGVTERAYQPRAHIYRLNEPDNTRRLLRAPLEGLSGDVALADGDSIVILSRENLATDEVVYIEGYVKEPGEYVLAEGMTLKDLILAAQGFTHGAYVLEAEVSRLPDPLQRSDTTALVLRVALEAPRPVPGDGNGNVPLWLPDSAELTLEHGDHVFVRKAPGYDSLREVSLTGQVMLPGRYVLESREERVTDLLARAGGVTGQAYAPGMHVVRGGRVVAADLNRALENPADRNNILLEAGDSIHVPAFDPTVIVTGQVNFEARVLHRPGAGMDYYVEQAGGYTDDADKERVTVTYQNGQRAAVGGFLFFDTSPRVEPGSAIFVPAEPATEQGFDWDQFLSRTLAVMSTAATVIIAVSQIRN